ncbi:MAG: bifunctional phosphoribosylaminoimidazolecarboxamide formyltransferase/inosine monophosphate cyclohydrolase [Micavibrio aeruginosavorus]|uniref:Bifunctional purine biosynthesis protein PurH n=1 Tax=Micavibrio aeruginosavorus TaxID=349221 RepID=A0A2W5N0B9_9BACT|nr:MAG: bifunctional phosphoribosylaminoimidazolecarboxamide formyltransferase/inosine monophosphate cyclohydrolase [Micavibrio aeruginosavorus]
MTSPLPVKIKRALLSVSDKTGLVDFAKELSKYGVELLSTGGTSKALKDAGLTVKDVSDHTGFPEMMDGRVKTLHPKVHGGILSVRDNADHKKAQEEHSIGDIDLVVVNLYPFVKTVASGADYDTCIENIDIGGPAMVRSAAKNHAFVAIVTDPADYSAVVEELTANNGATSFDLRKKLAARAYAHTAAYDSAISGWFAQQDTSEFPRQIAFAGTFKQSMRYGENPHQSAALYSTNEIRPGATTAQILQGKELSYNNINDTDAAYELVAEFDAPAVAIIKHANPCGVATGKDMLDAYTKALACDPVSAFGGIIALNRTLDGKTASEIIKLLTEVIIAPDIDADALEIIAAKKNVRVLKAGGIPDVNASRLTYKPVAGGMLVQSSDNGIVTRDMLKVVTKRAPTDQEINDMLFAFKVCKHVKSNAIVYVKDQVTVGIGAGQMNRRDSSRIAAARMAEFGLTPAKGAPMAVASDAFFPFPDGLLAAAEAGATCVIQPGGSLKDADVIAAADEHSLAMVFTGMRHFRH